MPVLRMALLPGRGVDIGKITEGKAKLRWLAATSTNYDTEITLAAYGYSTTNVGQLLPLPLPFVTFHPAAAALGVPLLCRGISFNQDAAIPRKWVIEADYSSEPLKSSEEDQASNPLQRPPVIKWSSQQYRLAIDRDVNGQAVINSAGDYFDPPVEVERSRWVATVEKNVTQVPPQIIEYTDAINSGGFSISGAGVGARVAKLMDIGISERKSEQVGNQTINYYTFSYSLELRPETWKLKVLDQGYRYKTGNSIRQIIDDSNPPRPVTSPRLLSGGGSVLSNPSPSNAVFREFDAYVAKDFSILPGLNEIG